ncbi:MAG: LysR family transcriptional regulator [Pyramidobacter sp.]|nr:LysR family transcriptional regulator [Pyramidobacter sp.]
MLNNYNYFITLAEELNISRAAEKLYISHQCLSKYLKNLEIEYQTPLLERAPKLKLTLAGEALLETFRKVQFLEQNLQSQLEDIKNAKRGVIRLGTTEGRYRILMPELLAQYHKLYPDVDLDVRYATSGDLAESIRKNELDVVLLNRTFVDENEFEVKPLIDEKLYLIVSDNMLARYFPDQYPECKDRFLKEGVDLADFQEFPFVLNTRKFKSRMLIDAYALTHGLSLKCVLELTQLDVHFQLTANDYAASFCWTMYLPTVIGMNRKDTEHHLNIFRIRKGDFGNQFVCAFLKGKMLPQYGRDLISQIRSNCSEFSAYEPEQRC